ncbi:MAG TPA: AraC family transcriptional regulator ligand-binding domain-containing protein [Polyangiaceae bacterium]|nr:AraC family transcriptional regulator ligand-binding domain-containing protein [Polyangiaceae bacterium]
MTAKAANKLSIRRAPHGSPIAPQVSSRMARRLILLAESLGLSAEKLCQAHDLNPELLEDRTARIPLSNVLSGLEQILEETRHPALGLALARCAAPDSYHTPALLLMASACLRDGFQHAFQYQRLWGDGDRFTFSTGIEVGRPARESIIAFRVPGARRAGHSILEVCALAETMLAVRYLTGELGARACYLALPSTLDSPTELAKHFGITPELGSAKACVGFTEDLVTAPLPHANALFLQVFERQAREELAALPPLDDWLARVRAAISQGFARGRYALVDSARSVGMSERTLERRLAERGLTYQGLVDAIRKPQALHLLRAGHPVDEIAVLLGYSERSSFHRACMRWFRMTPAALRRAHTTGTDR